MDEQLKARLIGAAVLVVLAVVLIPELLSGRKPTVPGHTSVETARGTRTYTIDLGGAVAAGARLEPAIPAAARPSLPNAAAVPPAVEPEPAAETAADAASPAPISNEPLPMAAIANDSIASKMPVTTAAIPVAKPSEVVAKDTSLPATAPVAGGQWAVQVGAFGNVASANKLISDLRRDGFTAFEAPLHRAGKTLHRVRVGPEADKASAERLSGQLKARGLPATVVAND